MRRAEWDAVADASPATVRQVGRVHREFARLGWPEADRAGRLAACAVLLGLDGLATSRDLSMGQAGRLIRVLSELPDLRALSGELAARRAGPGRDREDAPGVFEVACVVVLIVAAAVRSRRAARGH